MAWYVSSAPHYTHLPPNKNHSQDHHTASSGAISKSWVKLPVHSHLTAIPKHT